MKNKSWLVGTMSVAVIATVPLAQAQAQTLPSSEPSQVLPVSVDSLGRLALGGSSVTNFVSTGVASRYSYDVSAGPISGGGCGCSGAGCRCSGVGCNCQGIGCNCPPPETPTQH